MKILLVWLASTILVWNRHHFVVILILFEFIVLRALLKATVMVGFTLFLLSIIFIVLGRVLGLVLISRLVLHYGANYCLI